MINIMKDTTIYPTTVNEVQYAELLIFLKHIKQCYPDQEQLAFVCIGTDRSTGDAFGPLLGTLLSNFGFSHVYGTLESPCDAEQVGQIVAHLNEKEQAVIAIDACLGSEKLIGTFACAALPLVPGAGVGRTLPTIGDYSIKGIVNKRGLKSYWQLQHTSLFFVYRMVYTLYAAIEEVWKEGDIYENINRQS